MDIHVENTTHASIADLREAYRTEAGCQVVRDSILRRGLADAWQIELHGERVGYAGVWNRYTPDRLMEFFVLPEHRSVESQLFSAVVRAAGATSAEAQTNIEPQYRVVREHTSGATTEKLLFGDGADPGPSRPDLGFRARRASEEGPEGEWVVTSAGRVVGAGGILHHYNPPYADLFMEVVPEARGHGVGSFLVGQLRRECLELGKIPAARCDPTNEASRRTLLRGGLVEVGAIVFGRLRGTPPRARL